MLKLYNNMYKYTSYNFRKAECALICGKLKKKTRIKFTKHNIIIIIVHEKVHLPLHLIFPTASWKLSATGIEQPRVLLRGNLKILSTFSVAGARSTVLVGRGSSSSWQSHWLQMRDVLAMDAEHRRQACYVSLVFKTVEVQPILMGSVTYDFLRSFLYSLQDF